VKKSYLGKTIAMCWGGALLGSGFLFAQQAQKGDWSVAGADAGQSGWQKAESKLSKDSVPTDFKFLWKIQLGPMSRTGESYSEPLLAARLINAQGFKDIAFWGYAVCGRFRVGQSAVEEEVCSEAFACWLRCIQCEYRDRAACCD